MKKSKPIRVFWSPLSHRFYASRAYKEDAKGFITITGEQFDVTNDIAALVLAHNITFSKDDPGEPQIDEARRLVPR